MKKTLSIFLTFLTILILFGCHNTTDRTTYPSNTNGTTTDPLPLLTKETIEFENFSTQFISETAGTEIPFYYFSSKPQIPFVDVTDFITLLNGLIDETTQVTLLDDHTVKVFVEYELTPEEMAEIGTENPVFTESVIFDFLEQTVTAPNIDSFDYFSGESETDFGAGLELVDSYEEELPGFSADVSEYGFSFEIIQEGDSTKYLLPLSLADLFLTGSMFDVVQNGDMLYGIDTYQLNNLPAKVTRANGTITDEIKTESRHFLSFVFDYFYGLKDYKSIDSFETYVEEKFLGITPFEKGLYTFVDSLEDMHTGVITTGHYNPSYEHYRYYDDYPQHIIDYFNSSYGCNCDLIQNDENFEIEIEENSIAYLKINGFTEEFRTEVAPYMEEIREANVESVVLDLSCNGGGVLAGVYHLLNYLTNDDITVYTTTQGARSSWTYDVEGDLAIDADFFIVTSSVTYSAANLFTALAKEMGLAKTIGEKTGGGACSIKTIVLPNGAILQISSNMNLSFSTFETVEEGIDVDYALPFSENGAAKIKYYQDYLLMLPADYPTLAEFKAICDQMTE